MSCDNRVGQEPKSSFTQMFVQRHLLQYLLRYLETTKLATLEILFGASWYMLADLIPGLWGVSPQTKIL